MSKEVELIKESIDYLLKAELSEENGWSKNDIRILNDLLNIEFEVVKELENDKYLIELVTDRFAGGQSSKIIGYKESVNENEIREYCENKTKQLEGTYNETLGYKFYIYKKIELLLD